MIRGLILTILLMLTSSGYAKGRMSNCETDMQEMVVKYAMNNIPVVVKPIPTYGWVVIKGVFRNFQVVFSDRLLSTRNKKAIIKPLGVCKTYSGKVLIISFYKETNKV